MGQIITGYFSSKPLRRMKYREALNKAIESAQDRIDYLQSLSEDRREDITAENDFQAGLEYALHLYSGGEFYI